MARTLYELRARVAAIQPTALGWLVEYANIEQALDHGAVNGRWTRQEATDALVELRRRVGGVPNVYGRLYDQTAAVICRKCEPGGDPLPITMSAYTRAQLDPDAPWECPRCGGEAEWDRLCPETRPAAELVTEEL